LELHRSEKPKACKQKFKEANDGKEWQSGQFQDSCTKAANSIRVNEKYGGRDRARTGDPLLAKQVLSQLSYTPTVGVLFILKHFRAFQNPFLRFSAIWSEPLE
jgi:hypothetical protein